MSECRHNWSEMNWKGEDVCSRCGQTRQQAGSVEKIIKHEKTADEIRNSNLAHPVYGYIIRLIEKMAADIGVRVKVVFRNNSTAYAWKSDLIVFGYWCAEDMVKDGYSDGCKTTQWAYGDLWKKPGITGAHLLAIHEFAHILQHPDGMRPKGVQYHDNYFASIVKRLIRDYPVEG